MKQLRPFLSVAALALLAAPTAAGCDTSALVTSYPALAPIIGPRPTAVPFTLSRGHIKGTVYGAMGKEQTVGQAFVTTGSISAYSANPVEGTDVEETDDLKDKDNLTVLHDFSEDEDGSDVQLAVRIIRKNPVSQEPKDRYVYLKEGEFFLEGIPEGVANLRASYGGVESAVNQQTVYKNTIVEDVSMNLFLPESIGEVDGELPKVAVWSKLDPPNGVAVSVELKAAEGTTGIVVPDITYKPEPPDVAITLKAPPGSAGTVVSGYEVLYSYKTQASIAAGKGDIEVGPILVPTPPIIVPPAGAVSFGPPVVITVPVGSRSLNNVFDGPVENQPGLVIATIEFKDEDGQPVLNKNLTALTVSVPLRAL